MGEESVETVRSLAPGALSRRTILVGAAGLAGSVATGLVPAMAAAAAQQDRWRWCKRCQCLFYEGLYTTGWCVQGGGHNWEGSGNYKPHYGDRGQREDDWHWCQKCQSMWRGGNDHHDKACPSGTGHSKNRSGNYSFEYGDGHGNKEQPDWRRCRRCLCMCYSRMTGYCPRGGNHNFNGSYKYNLPYV